MSPRRRDDDGLLLLGAAAAGVALLASGRRGGTLPVRQWPLPTLLVTESTLISRTRAYQPVVSDGYHAAAPPRVHLGSDVMYRRTRKWGLAQRATTGVLLRRWDERRFDDGPPSASSGGWFFCPPHTPVRPVAPGRLWSARVGDAGGLVVIDHGTWVSQYLHLSRLNVPTASGGRTSAGEVREVGLSTILGHAGADPRQGSAAVRHLHLELWTYRGSGRREGESERVRWDPGPALAKAEHWTLEVVEGQSPLDG